ncbi:glycerophosphodiester phosphodiesterase [Rummeliibacillus sp. G93]|uniref:glycerophosphodiester phosphodiesterase n=1 Tax=Rummeliibacillus sp. G93 TaxID=2939494 RepID=UPI00201CA520|nr:glycerophosphodiester phosphodiesterase family protein [Rummeliibacillus sp. G93]UQW98773.1 glycerophosphodiester phosphodiesterase [Rummeliibacillus sp. G93]
MSRPLVFAHRGASARGIENTLDAFELALESGADGIELDIQATKDHIPVVIHDHNLRRLTGKNELISNLYYQQVKLLHVGKFFFRRFSGAKISTFDEFLGWHKVHSVPLNVELKESLLQDESALRETVAKCSEIPNLHISSFHPELLEKAKEIAPRIETALIATKKLNWAELDKLPYVDVIHANKSRYYKKRYLDALTAQGRKCRFYNITGDEQFLKEPHDAVIGWITDYPEKVRKMQETK